tara:strand:- start:174 stop:398 length:225 start_codon:yes stop_codon:yes gene_type:complete
MKYVLILTLCNFVSGEFVCPGKHTHIAPYEYSSWTSCVLDGYRQSHNVLKETYGPRIEAEKLAIKFRCKGVEIT